MGVSQGNAPTRVTYGGTFNNRSTFYCKFTPSVTVKKFWKSFSVWQSYRLKYSGLFFGHGADAGYIASAWLHSVCVPVCVCVCLSVSTVIRV